MALTPTEEAQTRQLIAQEAPLLSLASNEPTITSKLGATKVNLSQLPAASAIADADILLIRQGTSDKSVAASVFKTYAAAPIASETVAGIVRLATAAETLAGTSQLLAVDPANLATSYPSIQGAFKNLVISTTGTSAPVTVSADELVVESAANAYRTLRAVSVTPSLAVAGVNGLDTGTSAASTWYAVWVIWNGTTTAGLLSLSATAPAMPSGYTHKARVGWIRTDSTANKYPLPFVQYGQRIQYKLVPSSNLLALPIMASGVAGSPSAGTLVSASTSAFCPPTAFRVHIIIGTGATASGVVAVAPNSNYGNFNSSNPPPFSTVASSGSVLSGELTLEVAATIYYAANTATCTMNLLGWTDQI